MNEDQLHRLYAFLTRRFDAIDDRFEAIDRRFDRIDARFNENELIQNEILNALGTTLTEHQSTRHNHDARITKLQHRPAA